MPQESIADAKLASELVSMPESHTIFPLRLYLAAVAMFLPLLATAATTAAPQPAAATAGLKPAAQVPIRLYTLSRRPLVWDNGLDSKFVQCRDNGARGIRATLEVCVEKPLQQLTAACAIRTSGAIRIAKSRGDWQVPLAPQHAHALMTWACRILRPSYSTG
jgi:hypothetical protein